MHSIGCSHLFSVFCLCPSVCLSVWHIGEPCKTAVNSCNAVRVWIMGGQRNRVLGKGLHFPMGMGVFRGHMILINRFSLPLLFHNHRSFPAIRGYHLTLPLLLYTFNCLCHSTLPPCLPPIPLALCLLENVADDAFPNCSTNIMVCKAM